MKRAIPLTLLLLTAACGGDPQVGSDRSAITPEPSPGTCQKTEEVCTASEPPICSTVCVDEEPPSCELVEVCTLSEPATCYQVCKDECSGGGVIESPPSGTGGGGGEPVPVSGTTTCQNPQTVCTMSYPSTCYDYCADADPNCVPVEVCTLSYPQTCTTICQSECSGSSSGSGSEGGTAPGGVPGSSGP